MTNTKLIHGRLLYIGVGLLIGSVFWGIGNDAEYAHVNINFLFVSMVYLVYAALVPTVPTFPKEMAVLQPAYYLAKTMADVPSQVIFPAVYCSMVYWMTGQPMEASRFFYFLSLGVIVTLLTHSLVLLIGAATSDPQVGTLAATGISFSVLLFSGVSVSSKSIPWLLRWMSYLSFPRYCFEGMMLSIYGFGRDDLICATNATCPFTNSSAILKHFSMTDSKLHVDFIILGIFIVSHHILTYFVYYLRYKINTQR